MGYRFPRRKLSSRDCPDPSLFREAAAPAAEEIPGNLNEHNVVAGTFPETRAAPAFLYDFHYVSVDADAHIDTNGTDLPDHADADSWQVPEGGDWARVGSMLVTYTAGEHSAWVIGWCYYGLNGSFSQNAQPLFAPRVQFALRVNGTVMTETITGTERPDDGAPRPLRPVKPIDPTPAFRTLDYESIRGTGAMGWHVKPVRVQCHIRLPQGVTNVELVARRTIADQPNITSAPDPVYVYNRKLISIEMKLGGTDAATGAALAISYPEDGDLLNAANTAGTQLEPLVNTINDLPPDAIKRAGLRKEHFPRSQVWQFKAAQLTASSLTVKTYPGFVNNGGTGASPNWDVVDNGAGTLCEVALRDPSGALSWNFTNYPAFVLVLSNVAFSLAAGAGAAPHLTRYGVFGLGFRYSGGATGLQASDQGWVNNPNSRPTWSTPPPTTYVEQYCQTDVPMLGFFDFRSAPPAGGAVDKLRLLASGWNTAEVDWDYSSIHVIVFHP